MNLMRNFDFCQKFTHWYFKWHHTDDEMSHQSYQQSTIELPFYRVNPLKLNVEELTNLAKCHRKLKIQIIF